MQHVCMLFCHCIVADKAIIVTVICNNVNYIFFTKIYFLGIQRNLKWPVSFGA